MSEVQEPRTQRNWWPFLAGVAAGAVGAALYHALTSRKGLDLRLIKASSEDPEIPPTVLVPGILGSALLRPDGTEVWLNVGNALGHYDLSLPMTLPLSESRDDLVPGELLGAEAVLPRLFGFTEYADLRDLLEEAGFEREAREDGGGAVYHIFTYDWRRDIVEAARSLHETLEALADARAERDARFNVIGHSMGGLVARYYLRYGPAEPEGPVTWAGARRIRNLILVATPNAGSIPAFDAILNGNRVGLSTATLAPSVTAAMPSLYGLLPPTGAAALLDHRAEPLRADLHDPATWERFGWGPFAPSTFRRRGSPPKPPDDVEAHQAYLKAVLARGKAFHEALARRPETPCPVRIVLLGGDCLPTLARAVVPEKFGVPPRFEAWTKAEAEGMFEAGDGRVTRASVLASHLPGAEESETGSGLAEVSHAFFGSADHHGIYREATFQSLLLRLLLRPARRATPARTAGAEVAAARRG